MEGNEAEDVGFPPKCDRVEMHMNMWRETRRWRAENSMRTTESLPAFIRALASAFISSEKSQLKECVGQESDLISIFKKFSLHKEGFWTLWEKEREGGTI